MEERGHSDERERTEERIDGEDRGGESESQGNGRHREMTAAVKEKTGVCLFSSVLCL